MKLPIIFMISGILIFLFGTFYPAVILVLDETPPTFIQTTPSNGVMIHELNIVVAQVIDSETPVMNVTFYVDSSYTLALENVTGPQGGPTQPGWWEANWTESFAPLTSGSHQFSFIAFNEVGLSTESSGTFEIYTGLMGTWYINGIEITSPTQELRFTDLTVTFKFVKSEGVDDSQITCKVWEGYVPGAEPGEPGTPANGTLIYELPYVGSSTWEGAYTFPQGGYYVLDLVAEDGEGGSIVLSIYNFGFGEIHVPEVDTPLLMQIFGSSLFVAGALLLWRRKR